MVIHNRHSELVSESDVLGQRDFIDPEINSG